MRNKTIILCIMVFLAFVILSCEHKRIKKVSFQSEGKNLVGHLHFPADFKSEKKYPALIVVGSWTTVKEQMAGLYAKKFSDKGFITLAFDFRNFGESEGDIRFYESPQMKIQDIKNAVTFLETLDEVAKEKISAFGVCAGAGYILKSASEDRRIKIVATAASWLHDGEAVKLFYGGEKGVQAKIAAARVARKKYNQTGTIEYIPTISTTDKTAAMYGPYDYYLNPKRGGIPEWSADRFAIMSWEDWLTYNPMPSARQLTAPTLMIHSDGSVLPDYTRKYFNNIKTSKKKLHWIKSGAKPPMEQFDFYDKEEKVNLSVNMATDWYNKHLA